VVENAPGGPAGAVDAAPDSGNGGVSVPGTRTMVRDGTPGRRVLVDMKPVRPAPDPAGLPKRGIWLFSGSSTFGGVPGACVPRDVVLWRSRRNGGLMRTSSGSSPVSSNAGRNPLTGGRWLCADAWVTASEAKSAAAPARVTSPVITPRRT
jgi:hypothetical protein